MMHFLVFDQSTRNGPNWGGKRGFRGIQIRKLVFKFAFLISFFVFHAFLGCGYVWNLFRFLRTFYSL